MNKNNFSLYNSIHYVIQCKCKLIISLLYIKHIDLSASNHSLGMVSITIQEQSSLENFISNN